MKSDFQSMKSEERSIILVASDEKYKELTQFDRKKLLWLILLPFGGVFSPLFASSVGTTMLAGIGVTSKFGLRSIFRTGDIPIPHLSASDAANRFGFDHGHPQNGMAYVLHATRPDYYLVPASANERLAQEKVAAFFELSSSLGAKKLELISAEMLETNAKVQAEVPIKQAAAQIGIEASFGAKGEVNRKIYSEFGKPMKPPHVPDDLQGWLDVDPMFRSLASTRLNGELHKTKASLKIEATVDFGAAAQAAIKSFKINVGGQYHKVARSVWSFEMEFWPKE